MISHRRFPFASAQVAVRRCAAPAFALLFSLFLTGLCPLLPALRAVAQTAPTTGPDDKDRTDASTPDRDRTPRDATDKTKDDRDRADKEKTDKDTAKNDKDKQGKPIYRPGRPPANPLVIVDPTTGRGNNVIEYNKDGTRKESKRQSPNFRDYRQDDTDPRTNQSARKLPLFGYNLFREARQTIDRRRRGLSLYNDNGTATRRPRSTSTTRRTAGNGQAGRDANADDRNSDGTTAESTRTRAQDPNDLWDDTRARNRDDGNADDTPEDTTSDTRARDERKRNDSNDSGDDTSDSQDTRRNRDDNSDSTDSSNQRSSGILDSNGQVRLRQGRRAGSVDDTSDDTSGDSGTSRTARTKSSSIARRNSLNSSDDYLSDYPDSVRQRASDLTPQYSRSDSANDDNYTVLTPLDQMRQNVNATPPATYQLSSGDRLLVRIESPTLEAREMPVTVNAQGQVDLHEEGVPPISVLGRNVTQTETLLNQRLRRYFRNVVVTVTLRKLHTIAVMVSGEAYLPGTYVVPAVTSAMNVLFAAGGPTDQGSLRSILVKRGGKTIGTIDCYKWIRGEQSDISLQAGDILYIPGSTGRVTLRGEVRNEAAYEIREGETLADVLRYADGVKASAVEQNIQVSTLQPGAARIIKTIDLRNTTEVKNLPLYDGDAVSIASVRPVISNKVTIVGAVEQPSDYPLTPNMRVSNLLRNARGLLSEAYLGRASLYRWNPDGVPTHISIDLDKALQGDPTADLPLVRWDKLEIYTQQEAAFVGTRKVTVNGAVQRAGVMDYSAGMKLSDLLIKAGGPMPDAQQIVVEHQHGDGTFAYEYATVADVTHDSKKDITVQDNDVVAVYRIGESQFTPDHIVSIRGAVNGEGYYPRGENMHLSELVRIAGGFKPGAGLAVKVAHARRPLAGPEGRLEVASVNFDSHQRCAPQDDLVLEDGDVVTVQALGGIEDHPAVVTIKGAVNKEGPIIITSKTMRLSDVIKEAGGLRKEAFPEGSEFTRDPKNLGTATQMELSNKIASLSNLLNDKEYRRELAKSDIERIRAASSANDSGISLGGAQAGANGPGTAVAAAVANQLATHDLVTTPRKLTDQELIPYGGVAINLPQAMKKPGSLDDLIVMDGDVITVPEEPTTVSVTGAVIHPNGVPYRKNAPVSYYIAAAGDYTVDARKDAVEVIRRGGGLIPASKVKEIRPGDVILVPNKVLAEKISTNRPGFDSIFKSVLTFGLAARLFGL